MITRRLIAIYLTELFSTRDALLHLALYSLKTITRSQSWKHVPLSLSYVVLYLFPLYKLKAIAV